MSEFDADAYPGRPRILFIGWPATSHTQSWIDLLQGTDLNVRLFCLAGGQPPAEWPVHCYLTAPEIPYENGPNRRTVYPAPSSSPHYVAYLYRTALASGNRIPTSGIGGAISAVAAGLERIYAQKYAASVEDALRRVIREWRPDIIHTLGFEPASYIYLKARKRYGLAGIGRWVAQARGGPDLALNRYSADFLPLMQEVFATCDHFIADNQQNYDFALASGLDQAKTANPGMGIVSGPGGLDIDALRSQWTEPPSLRERVIVWPKAYEINTAKAMPVFEAILQAWDRIQPCRIEMLWMTQPEVQLWYNKLFPPEIKCKCPAHLRLSRDETLAHMAKARVMLAPSLSDGIPNTMMEAMALGAVPLVSPLETITPVVRDEENVLFARNLYPNEIATALIRLMTDDALVDRIAANNLVRIREMADRKVVCCRAIAYYEEVASLARATNRYKPTQ
jgi:glycosyltransferase involved in cell wall biosynthesis